MDGVNNVNINVNNRFVNHYNNVNRSGNRINSGLATQSSAPGRNAYGTAQPPKIWRECGNRRAGSRQWRRAVAPDPAA
jgi:hypothetical protein